RARPASDELKTGLRRTVETLAERRELDPELALVSSNGRGASPKGGADPRPSSIKEKLRIVRCGAFSTGGGALRWPSGSTLVRTDGPPPFRAVHSPLLTGAPATHNTTASIKPLQLCRASGSGSDSNEAGQSPGGRPVAAACGDEEHHEHAHTETEGAQTACAVAQPRSTESGS